MDDSLCILWPYNDCLFLQDIRENDLGRGCCQTSLIGTEAHIFLIWVSGTSSSDPIMSVSFCSFPPLHWWFQDQRETQKGEIKWLLACSFCLPTWKFHFLWQKLLYFFPILLSSSFMMNYPNGSIYMQSFEAVSGEALCVICLSVPSCCLSLPQPFLVLSLIWEKKNAVFIQLK